MPISLPPEWYPQSGIMISWPAPGSDWDRIMDEVTEVYCHLVEAISLSQKVLIVCQDESHEQSIRQRLSTSQAIMERLIFAYCPYNDTWARDFGPITVIDGQQLTLLDFGFNGWGDKFIADLDNQVSRCLYQQGTWNNLQLIDNNCFILEGGSIESDGNGTLMTTSACLLNPNRNPALNQAQIEAYLADTLGITRIFWLEHGYLAGDDTDSHIDTLARFADSSTIVYMSCDDPGDEHYTALQAMQSQLQSLKTQSGEPYRLVPISIPQAIFDDEGQRLPASYVNFLIINDAVLVPTYGDHQADQQAIDTLAEVFSPRQITAINCKPLIYQHGSLHCITMQLPAGVL